MQQGQKTAFFTSITFHILLGIGFFITFSSTHTHPIQRKLVVHSLFIEPTCTAQELGESLPPPIPTPIEKSKTRKAPPKTKPKKETSHKSKLLSQALKNLDRSKKTLSTSSTNHIASLEQLPSLQIDSPENKKYSAEEHYVATLIKLLQLYIQLPEAGQVSIQLTLQRSGTIKNITITKCSSSTIEKMLPEKLKKISYPAFGASFSGKTEQTFLLRLSHDLLWSTS